MCSARICDIIFLNIHIEFYPVCPNRDKQLVGANGSRGTVTVTYQSGNPFVVVVVVGGGGGVAA